MHARGGLEHGLQGRDAEALVRSPARRPRGSPASASESEDRALAVRQKAPLEHVLLSPLRLELDPVRLFSEIRAAQQALVEIADKGAEAEASATAEPALDTFLSGLRTAWKEGEVRPAARRKPSKPRGRTVPDPLDAATDELKARFEADPGATGRQLLDRLQEAYPGVYPDTLLRTVQRRLKIWRSERARALVLGPSSTASPSPASSGDALRYAGAPRVAGETPPPQSIVGEEDPPPERL